MNQLLQNLDEMVWSQIVAQAWSDPAVLNRLLADPRSIFAEHAIDVPQEMTIKIIDGPDVRIVEEGDGELHFIFPRTAPLEMDEEDLIGGGPVSWCGCVASARCGCGACGRCGACGCRCW